MVFKDYPRVKNKSGVHLGSRTADWNISTSGSYDFLSRLREDSSGSYPAVVVILSNNLYNVERNGAGCTVSNVTIRSQAAFDYLRQASQAGTKVIIRIYPSPGNFQDAVDSSQPHRILDQAGVTPQGRDYCTDPVPGDGKLSAPEYYRAIDDIAREMNAIHARNTSLGWSEFGFEPANEPNAEWFPVVDLNQDVDIQNPTAWTDMDAYFGNLYDYVHGVYPGISVFTPPMAQGDFAETKSFGTCDPMNVGNSFGYNFMPSTYTSKNDGYTWHNYWRQAKEFWDDSGNPCREGVTTPSTHHVFQFFPSWLQDQITTSAKPAFITEADLLSPCQATGNSITDKDSQWNATQESVWRFFSEEQGADYLVAWLLTESPYSVVGICPVQELTNYQEIKWHQAYQENGIERLWFPQWWQREE